jgi:hypothetical protein
VRQYPYPYSGILTFLSDVDLQSPEHGLRIKDFLNNQLGLPISDSLWVFATHKKASAFFVDSALNTRNVSGTGLPVYDSLVRQWHRGNIDHFHSWQADDLFLIKNEVTPPVALSEARTVLDVESPVFATGYTYPTIRLVMDAKPPSDLSIVLVDAQGKEATALPRAVRNGTQSPQGEEGEYFITITFDETMQSGIDGKKSEDGFSLSQLRSVELVSFSCKEGCNSNVVRVEREAFNRQIVDKQSAWLRQWNINPSVYTSHGGWTYRQNVSEAGTSLKGQGAVYDHPLIESTIAGQADDPKSPVYILDILKSVGVEMIWPITAEKVLGAYDDTTPIPDMEPANGYYFFSRTRPSQKIGYLSFEQFEEAIAPLNLDTKTARELYCSETCGDDQGDMVAYLIASGMISHRNQGFLDALYYTHFGSRSQHWMPADGPPFTDTTKKWFLRLADANFNFSGTVAEKSRLWSPAASVIMAYRLLQESIKDHVSVSGNAVKIRSWVDPVLDRRIPDMSHGTQDLHGLTLYVKDSSRATVEVDGVKIHSFSRNPSDSTGRESVTIIGDSVPYTLIDDLPLDLIGPVSGQNAEILSPNGPTAGSFPVDLPQDDGLLFQVTAKGEGQVSVYPRDLSLYNGTALALHYQKKTRGQVYFEIEFEDGGKVLAMESDGQDDAAPRMTEAGASGWTYSPVTDDAGMVHVTLPVDQMVFPAVGDVEAVAWKRPALLIGKIHAVRVGVRGAEAKDTLDIKSMDVLRANGNRDLENGYLLAGQVRDGSLAVQGIPVEIKTDSGDTLHTTTNQFGLYSMSGIKKDSLVSVAVSPENGRYCALPKGKVFRLRRNEAEADFNIENCLPTDWN